MSNEKEKTVRQESDGGVTAESGSGKIKMLTVIGQIEGHGLISDAQKTTKYEHLLPLLAAIEESAEIKGVLVMLNTAGGDVEAGLCIAEMLAGMKKPTVSLVLGGGHSIGVPIAVSCKKSFIVPSATMTLHPVRINGLVLGTPQSFSQLAKIQSRISRFIVGHSRISGETLARLLMETDELATDVGSVIDGEEAVKLGLIDEVGGIADALAALGKMTEAFAP